MSDTRRRPAREASADSSALVEALHRQLRDAIDALESGEQWQAWLDFGRKLHRYSFNNLILIFVQRPDASQVAGYRTWQSLGRQVRRGEKAIRVLAPVIRKAQVVDADGKPQRDPDGKPTVKQQVVGFRPAPVFDIAQTDGPPVPAPTAPELLSGEVPQGLWEALSAEVAGRGYQIRRGPLAAVGRSQRPDQGLRAGGVGPRRRRPGPGGQNPRARTGPRDAARRRRERSRGAGASSRSKRNRSPIWSSACTRSTPAATPSPTSPTGRIRSPPPNRFRCRRSSPEPAPG